MTEERNTIHSTIETRKYDPRKRYKFFRYNHKSMNISPKRREKLFDIKCEVTKAMRAITDNNALARDDVNHTIAMGKGA